MNWLNLGGDTNGLESSICCGAGRGCGKFGADDGIGFGEGVSEYGLLEEIRHSTMVILDHT